MTIKISSTKDFAANGVKILVYGPPGSEKTRMCATAPRPIILSAEAGLLSLSEQDTPVIEITSKDELSEAYEFLTESEEAKKFDTICLDSITEVAEVLLTTYKGEEKDPRAAYGRLNDDMASTIRSFRDIKGKNVYFTAKQVKFVNDENGITSFMPGMPGKTLLNGLSFFFDEVFASRLGKLEDGTVYRYLQTSADLNYEAKDRSGKLEAKAEPDLTSIFNQIMAPKK